MKIYSLIFLFCFTLISAKAQKLNSSGLKGLQTTEESLRQLARKMITDSLPAERMKADSAFTRTLVRALQVPHSFDYPFDSVQGISRLYAPDSSFRIFTWNLQYNEYYSRQRGAIQMRTANGSLKLFPLRDFSEFTPNAADSVRDAAHWIGAVYYNMIETEYREKKYYTLFGLDFHSIRSNKKWIEVLHFNGRGEPVFGGPFFQYQADSLKVERSAFRVELEYKKDARVLANFIPDLGMILIDHLISETNEPENPWTFIPDGDNEAFKWENGKWVHINKAFDFKMDMEGVDPLIGNPPVEAPILDKKGNPIQKKLDE
jgi:hypothetical protein